MSIKRKIFSCLATIAILASSLLSFASPASANVQPIPSGSTAVSFGIEKVTDVTKIVKDPVVLDELARLGIDKDYVELIQDYALSYDSAGNKLEKKSPYAQFYKDRISGKEIMVVSQLPMVNANGMFLDTTWATKDGKNFNAGINQFIASVATNKVTVIAFNDQPDGKVKKDNALVFQPQLYLNNTEVKPLVNTPTLLAVDPFNSNYTNNVLVWDYGICKRYLRLIEGSLLGSWVFASKPSGEVRIVYNQVGDYRLKLGQFAIDSDTELVTPADFDELVLIQRGYPVVISDSLTFYPNAHPEANSVDGYARFNDFTNPISWTNARAAPGNTATDTDTYTYAFEWRCDGIAASYDILARGMVLFYTATLPDTATILTATLSLYGQSKLDENGNLPSANIYSSNPASNTAIVAGDYDSLGLTAFSDTSIAYNSWLTGNGGDPETYRNDWVLNAAGRAAIGKTVANPMTKFGTRCNYDLSDATPPAWSATLRYGNMLFWCAEKGVGYKPQLVVVYTLPPTVTTNAATNIEETTAQGNGNVTAVNDTNITVRGFVWDTATHGDPGDVAPSASAYSNNWTETGSWGVGTFNSGANINGLSEGTKYYMRACAKNDAGYWAYGSEVTFLTKPDEPTNFVATPGIGEASLTWTKGTSANRTMVRYRTDTYPTGYSDGTQAYYDTGTNYNHTSLNPDLIYYYRMWSEVTEGGLQQYSDNYAQAMADPTGFYLVIYIDGIPSANTTYSGNVTANNNPWYFCQNGAMPYMEYTEIEIDGNQEGYWEWEYAATFTDQSPNNNIATPNFRTESSNAYVSANITAQEPVIAQSAPSSANITGWDMIPEGIDTPEGLFAEGGVSYPGAARITALEDSIWLPNGVIAITLALVTSFSAGLLVFVLTHRAKIGVRGSLFLDAITTMMCLVYWYKGAEVIPGFLLIPVGLIFVLLLLWKNPYSTPV